jgi:hypothetical protein
MIGPGSQLSVLRSQKEMLAKTAYDAFCVAMGEWLSSPPAWDALSPRVREGWQAAAKAVSEFF